jgi:hypothetical protein
MATSRRDDKLMAFTSKNATNWEMETISTEMQPWIIQGGGSDIAQKQGF